MLDFETLPAEIFDWILDYALVDCGHPRLCHLALLSRRWHQFLLPRIYKKWTYNGAKQSFFSLWSFFTTVLRSSHIASLVHSLAVGNWGFNHYEALGKKFEIIIDGLDLVLEAIHRAGLAALEEEIFDSISKGDRRPVMALLLTCLPNVRSIDAHVPRSDPVLGAVLRQALLNHQEEAQSGALSCLTSVRLWGEIYVEVDIEKLARGDHARLQLDDVWPIIFFPGLSVLSIFEVDVVGASTLLRHQGFSNVQDLTMVCSEESKATIHDIQAFLRAPLALRSLSCYIKDDYFESLRNPSLQIPNPALWDALQMHQDSLETLDLYRCGLTGYQVGRFDQLRSFNRLKRICINPEVLLGGCSKSLDSSIQLKDTLPSSPALQSITFYEGEGLREIPDLDDQVEDVLISSSDFPSLRLLRVDLVTESALSKAANYRSFQKTLNETRTTLSFVKFNCVGSWYLRDCQMSRGGICPALWQESYYMRCDGQQRFIKIRNRLEDLAGSDPEPSDSEVVRPSQPCITLSIPFPDHRGHRAYMLFSGHGDMPLPPLYSHAIYFTHLDIQPDDIGLDLTRLHDVIMKEGSFDYEPRLDCYFLPGASAYDCTQHYLAELTARGNYKAQIRDYRRARREGNPPPPPPGTLPGLVEHYSDNEGSGLFICERAHWQTGDQTMWAVGFRPLNPVRYDDWEREGMLGSEANGTDEASDAVLHSAAEGNSAVNSYNEPLQPPSATPSDDVKDVAKHLCVIDSNSPIYDERESWTVSRQIWELRHSLRDFIAEFESKALHRGWANW
ncbi:hypothetical protein BJY04DRAFT_220705 [Aspergillus karnatakaensis]|uniref:uncharacterized protein n=1 Tax=Aspergillus karnatakaensis TaxID=1810916 RepID=UPI003CCD75C2